jgi:hypothetical protein
MTAVAGDTSEEEDLERISLLIAELDSEESLLLGLDANPARINPLTEAALFSLRERRGLLETELAEVWARRCSRC